MEGAGLWMLLVVGLSMIGSGLPAWVALIGTAGAFAAIGVATGALPAPLLGAVTSRISGLLEHDLLQAMPLYVLMGALLNRLPLADSLFRTGASLFGRGPSGASISAVALGAILGPMNGSVGASVAALTRGVQPRLLERGVEPARGLSLVCVASTLGVVVPPSLVLILLGDAMMRAHTEAVNALGRPDVRIVNTQDVFRGTLAPAAIFVALCLLLAWWTGRRQAAASTTAPTRSDGASPIDVVAAVVVLSFILGLLAGVTVGWFYAVEAAAMGAFALFAAGLASRRLTRATLDLVLRDAMVVSGSLFALFVAATSFTLVFRAFGTDRMVDRLIAGLPGGALGATVAVLLAIALCAFVLDAFEIVFVAIPVVMPALLTRVPDVVWVSTLTLLVLQASFLLPPFGYALMMARGQSARPVGLAPLTRALLPFLAAQIAVLALVASVPRLAHVFDPPAASGAQAKPRMSDEDAAKAMGSMLPPPQD